MKAKFLVVLLVTVAGCGGDKSVTGPSNSGFPNYVKLQSDAGDAIGQGKSYEYSTANSIINVQSGGVDLEITIEGARAGRAHSTSRAALAGSPSAPTTT